MNTQAIGTQIQRKGSKVVWTIDGNNEFANSLKGLVRINDEPTELHIFCQPKNQSTRMYNWISIDNYNRNWKVL